VPGASASLVRLKTFSNLQNFEELISRRMGNRDRARSASDIFLAPPGAQWQGEKAYVIYNPDD
jgi:hypothetical protein